MKQAIGVVKGTNAFVIKVTTMVTITASYSLYDGTKHYGVVKDLWEPEKEQLVGLYPIYDGFATHVGFIVEYDNRKGTTYKEVVLI